MITAQPPQPSAPSRSPASQKPKKPAHTGSIAKAIAVRAALDLPLRPGLDEEPERAREDAGDEQRAPDGPATRHLDLPERDRDEREAAERGEHLRLRERDGVVAGRVALHQHDLERVGGRAGEHEQVADRIARADA